MPKKQDVKAVAMVALGVMLAGWAMWQFRDVAMIAESRAGYGA